MRPALLVVLVCLSDNVRSDKAADDAKLAKADAFNEAAKAEPEAESEASAEAEPGAEDTIVVPEAGEGKDAVIKAEVPDVPDPPATQAAPPAGPPVVHTCPPPELDKFPRARHNQHRPVTIVTITSQALLASLTPRIRSPISA